MKDFIETLPKIELHLHIEGTLEPELLFKLARRNGVIIPFKSEPEVRDACHFSGLQLFLDIYYQGANVLIHGQALPHRDKIVAVGLDSSETGNPPEKFRDVYERALREGFLTVAYAGEEGPTSYISDALLLLKASRIDQGVRCVEDPALVAQLIAEHAPLTVCPLSNIKLRVFDTMTQHNIVELLRRDLCVTINSDDPAYFGGYMTANFLAVAEAHPMSAREIAKFTFNAIHASFISKYEKHRLEARVNEALGITASVIR